MPDDELTQLAASGELRKNLDAQVKRMLADPRSEALVENFTGQWLQTRDLGGVAIDARAILARDSGTGAAIREQKAAFEARQTAQLAQDAAQAAQAGRKPGQTNTQFGKPTRWPRQIRKDRAQRPSNQFALNVNPPKSLDQATRDAMKRETEMFFSSIMHEDRSIDELIECDYTFLNEKLADFYGLTNLACDRQRNAPRHPAARQLSRRSDHGRNGSGHHVEPGPHLAGEARRIRFEQHSRHAAAAAAAERPAVGSG